MNYSPVSCRRFPSGRAVAIAWVAFALATVGDIVTTLWARGTVGAQEGDPLMAWIFSHAGGWFIFLPLVASAPLIIIGTRVARDREWRIALVSIVVVLWVAAAAHGVTDYHNLTLTSCLTHHPAEITVTHIPVGGPVTITTTQICPLG